MELSVLISTKKNLKNKNKINESLTTTIFSECYVVLGCTVVAVLGCTAVAILGCTVVVVLAGHSK